MIPVTAPLVQSLAPTGSLRVSINTGNPVLAKLNATGDPTGVSVDLASLLAKQLNVPLVLRVFDNAAKCVNALELGDIDMGFFAIDPARAEHIHFSVSYVHIEGAYAVSNTSSIIDNAQVDAANNRVVVGKGSAYDLFLSRHLKTAKIIRASTAPEVVGLCVSQGYEVAAGVRQQLEKDVLHYPQLRVLPGHFMVIKQALGVAKERGALAIDFLNQFMTQAIHQGNVADLLLKHKIEGAKVATL